MSLPAAIPDQADVSLRDVPVPCAITPELLKLHNITDEEYAKILARMGRTPSLTELGIYSVMWSEHCSYKSSRVHLKRLPTKGFRESGPGSVMQGPGENAGIIDVGDGWACAFKIESHNHPSYIEPYQGAATGVGGILRDIFTMGARPMAVMDSLRFGPLSPEEPSFVSEKPLHSPPRNGSDESNGRRTTDHGPQTTDYAKNRSIMEGVVHGVAGYGNCFGVPNLGGETRFEPCYSGNPLLNAFALGLVRHDEIFYAKATGVGNPVIYVGAKTGRDGIHGATMASEEFKEGSEQKRPNVQMGDPFMEKLLLEACLEAMKTGAVAGIQDMGAAGLTCSTCEMGARGGVGLEIELDLVPQRDSGMSSYEIMLSESQERMLLVAHAGREQGVLDIFAKWGLDAAVVGTVIPENRMKVRHGGVLVADLSNESLTDDAPVYHRPVGEWKAPVPLDPPASVLEELEKPRDYTADLKKLLASPNICSKAHIYEQYDSMVQTNTVFGPGQAEAGVIRIKGTGSKGTGNTEQGIVSRKAGTPYIDSEVRDGSAGAPPSPEAKVGLDGRKPERGLAIALAGNARWCYLDPKLGAMHAVAEAARKVACTGATPVAATNCLNFGNPMKPEIMAQLSQAIDGIDEACTALGTPITGGNVSLYNETKGEGIYPTPVIGVVGILDDVTKAVPSGFQSDEEIVVRVYPYGPPSRLGEIERKRWFDDYRTNRNRNLGSFAFAQICLGTIWGEPQPLSLDEELGLQQFLQSASAQGLVSSASDVGDGGLVVAIARAAMSNGVGFSGETPGGHLLEDQTDMFLEDVSTALITCHPDALASVVKLAKKYSLYAIKIGRTGGSRLRISVSGGIEIDESLNDLRKIFTGALEEQLESEVVLA